VNLEYTLKMMNLMKNNIDMFVFNEAFLNKWKDLQISVLNVVRFTRTHKMLSILTTLELFFNEEPNKSRFLEISISADFELENFEYLETDGRIEFPHDFISMLLGIMYSTIRGVVLDKPILSGLVLLPLMDTDKLHREVIITQDEPER